MVPNTAMKTNGDETGGTTLVSPGVGVTEQRSLRTSPRRSKTEVGMDDTAPNDRDLMEEERALELAEEKMLLDGDEEIESIDEHGNAVVDTEQVDRRNLTVALVNSVVETSSSGRPKGKDAAALRARVDKAAKEKAAQQQKAAQRKIAEPKAAVEASSTQAEAEPHSYSLRKRKMRKGSDSDDSDSEPTSPRSPRMRRSRRSSGASSASKARQTRRGKEEQNVPNPLLQAAAEQAIASALGASSGSQGVTNGDSGRNRAQSISLLNVPCPPPAAAPQAETKPAPSEAGVTRRGRIFSIDIDPAGLDFPDMTVEGVIDPHLFDASGNPRSSSISSDPRFTAVASRKGSTSSGATPPFPAATNGRDRAMSFEFFSFGINADEDPLPDVAGSSGPTTRPRGNSIIFDPVSFQDGGIHEEKILRTKGSRGNSLDLVVDAANSIAGLPSIYGGAAASRSTTTAKKASVSTRSSSKSSRHQSNSSSSYHRSERSKSSSSSSRTAGVSSDDGMATLPSSLLSSITGNSSSNNDGALQHATFQMELLNKDGRIGIYLPEQRRARIAKFLEKRKMRIWRKRIKYDCRKKLADSRPRIKGRFVKRSDVDEE